MGIETSPELGGAGCSFTSAILAIEGALWSSSLVALLPRAPSRAASVFARSHSLPAPELAKVDASVSVLCDVHNTLVRWRKARRRLTLQVDTLIRKYATTKLQEKYLPKLSESSVRSSPPTRG